MPFKTVLVANRGEIAVRIIRACRTLGLRVVAVCSEADRGGAWLQAADDRICIGPARGADSYLDADALLLAAEVLGADAIHPGYGFLAENADFAAMTEQAGLTFIGPTSGVIRLMGDKISAKEAMRAVGVPCVPGSDGALPADPARCAEIAGEVGYPVIIKAAGGGGGRGMRVVRDAEDLVAAIATTREEAFRAFGNAEVYLEKFLERPRHVEIQVLCDNFGNAIWLGERDCSIQRRHQKLIEEAPAPGISREAVAALGDRCAAACRAIGYRGVGTFEFLYESGTFAFIEMNTRIQVEHTVTEEVTGIDIAREQLRVALGEPMSLTQQDVRTEGHAIECRINAEHSFEGRPSPGRITQWYTPSGPGIRVDSHMRAGADVPPHYDSLIAKIVASGRDRAECIVRMKAALADLRVEGVTVNTSLHQFVLDQPAFENGGVSIHFLERLLQEQRV